MVLNRKSFVRKAQKKGTAVVGKRMDLVLRKGHPANVFHSTNAEDAQVDPEAEL